MPTERLGGAPFFRVDCHREVAGNGWDEPCKSRGLRTVLWAAGGEIPPADPAAWNPVFLDPPKASAMAAIHDLTGAGVAVRILTGDNERVTQHVCAELGLTVTGLITGDDLRAMSEEALRVRLARSTCSAG